MAAAMVLLALAACAPGIHQTGAESEITREVIRDALASPPAADEPAGTAAEDAPPIPEMLPVVEQDPVRPARRVRLIDLVVDETVPLRSVLFELADQADLDLELDPRIEGSVIVRARRQPLEVVIERIARLAGLRYALDGDVLQVRLDEPYLDTHAVDYLNVVRTAESSTGTAVDVVTGSAGSGNASTTQISSTSSAAFWDEIATGLEQILQSTELERQRRRSAQSAAAAEQAAARQAVADTALEGEAGELVVEAVTEEPEEGEEVALFSINRSAGLISVFGTESQHDRVADYLARIESRTSGQVLIEARILEVGLDDDFSGGINWRTLFEGDVNFGVNLGPIVAEPPFIGGSERDTATFAVIGSEIQSVANFIERFGTVRTLSSPRLMVKQNQTAALKVTTNEVYFTLEFEREEGEGDEPDTVTIESEINTVPVGVIVTVQPWINQRTGTIDLTVRPSVTRIVGQVSDPAVAIASGGEVVSNVPIVAVQELESLVTLASGEVLVMGGLMQDEIVTDENGVPVLRNAPIAGNLFKSREDRAAKTELVIFLRATIAEGRGGGVDPVDRELYLRTGADRRPIF